jgi:hypothetical protein
MQIKVSARLAIPEFGGLKHITTSRGWWKKVEEVQISQVEFFCKGEGDMLKKLRCLPKSRFFSRRFFQC